MHRRIAILAVVASTLLLMGLAAGQALAAGDDNVPGTPVGLGTINGVVDSATDPHDVYCVQLFDGEDVRLTLADATGSEVSVRLIAPGCKSIDDDYTEVAYLNNVWMNMYHDQDVTYTPAKDGVYYLLVSAWGTGANYSIGIYGSAEKPPMPSNLRLRASATKVGKGRSVTLSAKLVDTNSALIPGYAASLYRSYDGHAWKKLTSLSSTTGDYTTKARITRKTWYRMRFSGDATWSACTSRVVTVSLR